MKHIHFNTISSTNSYLKENFHRFNNYTFVSSDYQFCGKGRFDRNWVSEKGKNLLFSVLIKDKEIIENFNILSLVSAVTIAEYLENKLYIKNVSIKWPNDIFINDKKVCGILLEGQIPDYIVIGIGLNVNQKTFNGNFNNSPTSISLETKNDIDIKQIRNDLINLLFEKISNLLSKRSELYNYFVNHNYLLNKEVSFNKNGNNINGKVIDIDKDFKIQIQTKDCVEALSSGEVFFEKF